MIQNIKTYTKNKYPDRISKCNAIGRILRYTMLISIVLFTTVEFKYVDIETPFLITLYSIITYVCIIPIISVFQFIDRKKNKEKYQISINLFWCLMAFIFIPILLLSLMSKLDDECWRICQEEHWEKSCDFYCD